MTDLPDSCYCDDVTADLVWAADVVGSSVVAHEHLVGGMGSTVIRCCFSEQPEPLVLRVIDDGPLLVREPDIIDREAEALRILASTGAPTQPRAPAPTIIALARGDQGPGPNPSRRPGATPDSGGKRSPFTRMSQLPDCQVVVPRSSTATSTR